MPPLALLAPLAASALGSTLLPAIAGSSILGIGTGTLGGILGGAAAGALTNEDDPLMGALLGGVGGGIGGPGLAEGIGSLTGGVGDLLGLGTGLPETIAHEGATALGAGAGTEASAAGLAQSAADIAQPAIGTAAEGTTLGSPTAGGAFTGSSVGQALAGAGEGGGIDAALGASPQTVARVTEAFPSPVAGAGGAGAGAAPTGAPPDWLARNKDWVVPSAGVVAAGVKQSMAGDQTGDLQKLIASNSALASGSGQLPAGMQAGIDSAKTAAKARMRSMFAQRGMAGSSSEAVALANIEQTAAAHGAELAQGFLDRGLKVNGMNALLYQAILQHSMRNDDEMSKAIGRLTQSLAA